MRLKTQKCAYLEIVLRPLGGYSTIPRLIYGFLVCYMPLARNQRGSQKKVLYGRTHATEEKQDHHSPNASQRCSAASQHA